MVNKAKTPRISKRTLLLIATILLFIGVGLMLMVQRSKLGSGTIPSKKLTATSSVTKTNNPTVANSTPTATGSPKDTTSGSVQSSSGELTAPYGSFVSNHHPDSSAQEESVCITSPGASCYLQFKSGSTIKTLDSQTVGDSGSAQWAWFIKDAGLTAGTWQITAFATLNGQSKKTNDQLPLEVQ